MRTTFLPLLLLFVLSPLALRAEPAPLLIGLDGEYGLLSSTSAQSIERGARVAIDEINEAGGLLGGRKLKLVPRDNRSVPARGVENIREFAAMPNLVAVLGGRFSPVILEELPVIQEKKIILLACWSSADGITVHDYQPSYTFRLSLRDSYAMPVMLGHARELGTMRVGLMVPNTGWGRSNAEAAKHYILDHEDIQLVDTQWYNWGEKDMLRFYNILKQRGAEAIILVANDREAAVLIQQFDKQHVKNVLPIISHWGVTGGRFFQNAGSALRRINFSVVQTFSLFRADPDKRKQVMARVNKLFGISSIEEMSSPVGFGHAYDQVHLLARAIELAGTDKRPAIRDALEKVRNYHGLTGDYPRPYTADRHDALRQDQVFMAKYSDDGIIIPLEK